MFSGIIERLERVKAVSHKDQTLVLVVETVFDDLELGESIAVNGVCLTVTEYTQGQSATFFVSSETIERTNLGVLAAADVVNLERAVRLETRLSGHLVQGHVDGMATLTSATPDGEQYLLEFSVPANLGRYCVEKGSITLNGISLTLNSVTPDQDQTCSITITIIPHTWENTNLHAVRNGDKINVEIDIIAKYVETLCQPYLKP
ncbi:riboflavin synthase [Profundibacter sp.]